MAVADLDKWEKIAGMLAVGVPDVQIADVVGISVGRITQLKSDEQFQQILEKKLIERAKEVNELNEGWDAVEKRALEIVQTSLKSNRNPDFALRAAMVANRATRRGGNGNVPLPTQMGERVLIQLKGTFVNRLQMLSASPEQVDNLQALLQDQQKQKRVNLLPPGQVKKLLLDEVENPQEVVVEDLGEFKIA